MKVHAALGLARGAAGKGNKADIVTGGIAGREVDGLAGGQSFDAVGAIVVKIAYLSQVGAIAGVAGIGAMLDFGGQALVAQQGLNLRLAYGFFTPDRTEERRVGKGGDSKGRIRGSPKHYKKKKRNVK